jgi:N-acetylglucosaminyldiphosphoundecaprenol N-acetyl-beta-D-mannosaminyltransferase
MALEQRRILGMRVDATSYADAVSRILRWSREGLGRYVCVATVHMVMEGYDDPNFQRIVNEADLVTPDGMPLVWALRLLGVATATRVYGPDLLPAVCEEAERQGVPVGFHGGSPEVLDRMIAEIHRRWPGLPIGYAWSPPFRPLTPAEDDEALARINESGARLVFVGLGCPKQERWMAEHRGRSSVVMVGVGAAFDFLSGAKQQAPRFLQRAGLEWFFRLLTEPARLWRRYLYHNPRYLGLFARQLVADRWSRSTRPKGETR